MIYTLRCNDCGYTKRTTYQTCPGLYCPECAKKHPMVPVETTECVDHSCASCLDCLDYMDCAANREEHRCLNPKNKEYRVQ
jgi:hypothetical protein